MSLMPFIRSLIFKHFAYYFKLVAIILLLNKIMSTYLQYIKKGLVYIIIIALFSRQPSFCTKCTKLNIYLLYNIYLVSNAKYTFFTRFYTL